MRSAVVAILLSVAAPAQTQWCFAQQDQTACPPGVGGTWIAHSRPFCATVSVGMDWQTRDPNSIGAVVIGWSWDPPRIRWAGCDLPYPNVIALASTDATGYAWTQWVLPANAPTGTFGTLAYATLNSVSDFVIVTTQ